MNTTPPSACPAAVLALAKLAAGAPPDAVTAHVRPEELPAPWGGWVQTALDARRAGADVAAAIRAAVKGEKGQTGILKAIRDADPAEGFNSAHPREGVRAELNPPRRIVGYTAREIAAMAPEATEWVVPGLLAIGAVTELTGKPKLAGKTTLECRLIAAVTGDDLSGHFLGQPVTQTGVVLMTEQTPATLREPLEDAGLLDSDRVWIVPWHGNRGIPFPEVVAQAVEACKERGWRVLAIDTISQWAGIIGDGENQSGAALAAMEPCQEAAGAGLAVLIVRHDRKSGGEVGESGRGSNAFTGAVDIVLQLARPEGNHPETQRQLSGLSRFRETPSRLVIDLTPDKGYVVLGDTAAVAAGNARRAMLTALPVNQADAEAQGFTEARVIAVAGKASRSTVQRVLASLMSTEHGPALVGCGTTKKPGAPGRPAAVYWLTAEGRAERDKGSAQTPAGMGKNGTAGADAGSQPAAAHSGTFSSAQTSGLGRAELNPSAGRGWS